MPEIASKLMADNPRAKIPDMAKVVEADAGVATALLRIVNSSFYGFSHSA